MTQPLILVTGCAGRIGRAVVKELTARGHRVRGFDRVPTPNLPDAVIGTITDAAACARAAADVHTLIHLAATPDDVDDVVGDLVQNNVVGVYRVFEAARQANVKRLILASSGQVVWGQRKTGPLPIGVDVQPSPRSWYAAMKLFLEGAGRAYADAHGISVLAVRLGWCPRPGQEKEIAAETWAQDVYFSPNDAGRFFACAVESPTPIHFAVVYATSLPVRTCPYDMEPARTLLGYVPREKWPQGVE
jgi:nucleoside-diphosphate-sugar epimerase